MRIVESLLVLGLSCFPVWAQQESKEPPSKQETAKLRLEAAKKKSKAADQAWSDSGLRNHGFASYGPSEAMMDAEAEFCEAQNEFILASGQPDGEVTHCKVTSSKKGGNLTYGMRYARVVLGTWWREGCPAPLAERAPALGHSERGGSHEVA